MKVTVHRLTAASAAAVLTATALMSPMTAAAAVNSADAFVPVDDATKIQIHVTAQCSGGACTFNTAANLVVGGNPVPLPPNTWARENITLRSANRNVYQDVSYSAPTGAPPINRGSWNGPVNSRQLKSQNSALVSVTFNGGGTFEEFAVDGTSLTLDVRTGRPNTEANFIACADIQVTYPGVNLTTPTACATTHYN